MNGVGYLLIVNFLISIGKRKIFRLIFELKDIYFVSEKYYGQHNRNHT